MLEGTVGFWYRFYNGPKGRVQMNIAWSYLQRNSWTGSVYSNPNGTGSIVGTSDPAGNNNMVFTSLRYYIP